MKKKQTNKMKTVQFKCTNTFWAHCMSKKYKLYKRHLNPNISALFKISLALAQLTNLLYERPNDSCSSEINKELNKIPQPLQSTSVCVSSVSSL